MNSGLPYLEGEPTGLVSPPGWPWAPHGTSFLLTWTVPRDGGTGQNQPLCMEVWELRPAREQSQPAGHGWQSFHDVAPGMGRRACRFNAMATTGASGRDTYVGRSRITGRALPCPLGLPQTSARCAAPPCLIVHFLLAPRTLTAPLSSPPCSGLLRALIWALSLSTHKPRACGSRAPNDVFKCRVGHLPHLPEASSQGWSSLRPLLGPEQTPHCCAHPPVTHPGARSGPGAALGQKGPEDREGSLWSHRWDLGQMLPECSRTCAARSRYGCQARQGTVEARGAEGKRGPLDAGSSKMGAPTPTQQRCGGSLMYTVGLGQSIPTRDRPGVLPKAMEEVA